MNLKLTAVASAVAMSIALPVTAQAEGSGFYGSARVGLEYSDAGGDADATLDLRSWASRMGFKGETEMANGLTGFGKYEFGVNLNGATSMRQANVGIKGDFGQVLLGRSYHTWYNNVISPVDQPWWGSCNGCISYTGRTEAVTYQGNFGAGSGGISLYFDEDDAEGNELDGYELGATFPLGGISLGLGIQDLDNGTEPTIGVAVKGSTGTIGYAANVTAQAAPSDSTADDRTGIDLFLSFGNAYVDVGTIMGDNDAVGFTLGYTKSIGDNTTAWFEASSSDSGVDGSDASTALRAALKHDWK